MNKDQVNKKVLIDALFDIDDLEVVHFPEDEQDDWDNYGHGLFTGLVAGLTACGLTFDEAMEMIDACITDSVRITAVPEIWRERLMDRLVQPPTKEIQLVIQFLISQDCDLKAASGPWVSCYTPNGVFYQVTYEDGKYTENLDGEITVYESLEDLKASWE